MPDVVDVKAWVLGYGVVSVNFDGFSDSPGVPVSDVGDEVAVVPVDAVVFLLGMLDDSRSLPVAVALVGLVFLESGVEVAACLSDVHFPAVARNLVDAWLFVGWVLVLV